MAICYLSLGSNLGNRRRNIKSAVKEINSLKLTKVLKSSKIMETLPQGGPGLQPKFLNAALKIETKHSPLRLLKKLQVIEKELGRKKTLRWGPRSIDLDILFYNYKTVNTKELRIPHSEVFKRRFVMQPLLEVL